MIKSIFIEIRPGLGSCSVCITLKDVSYNANFKIRKSVIVVNVEEEEELTIPLVGFEVEPLTLTCLDAKEGMITFRIRISSLTKIPGKRFEKTPPLKPNEKTKLNCKCDSPITEELSFGRVLPLPFHDIQISDMFCHGHEMSNSIEPRLGDCLYGIHFISINKKLLRNVKTNRFVKCKRCLSSVGLCKNENVKIWNVCIDLPGENITPVEEFKRIIKTAVEESFLVFFKIFLRCLDTDNGLLIKVVDKDLVLSCAGEDLKLKTRNIVKLKYEYYKSNSMKYYLEKEDVECIEVPAQVLNDGFNFLLESSQEIPPMFRGVEGELMAYLEI